MLPLQQLKDRFLDKVLGAPDLAQLTTAAAEYLEELGHTEIHVNTERGEVRSKDKSGGTGSLSLSSALGRVQRAARSERAAVLRQYVDGLQVPQGAIPAQYGSARPLLLPVLRSRNTMGLAIQETRFPGAPDDNAPICRPLVDDLLVALVIDRPESMAYVSERQIAQWGVTWDEAYRDALDNLRGLRSPGGWKQLAGGVWSGSWGDGYDSSRLLLEDAIWRLDIPDPVAFVPCRNVILVASAADQAAHMIMFHLAELALKNGDRSLSAQFVRLVDRSWVKFELSGPAEAEQQEMAYQLRSADYEAQKNTLLRQFETYGGEAPFLAKVMLFKDKKGVIREVAAWSEGVDTLLPDCNEFALIFPEAEGHFQAQLSRATVLSKFGHLLEATDHVPRRYRARSFPDRALLREVAAEKGLEW
jgi:hypothetical protein